VGVGKKSKDVGGPSQGRARKKERGKGSIRIVNRRKPYYPHEAEGEGRGKKLCFRDGGESAQNPPPPTSMPIRCGRVVGEGGQFFSSGVAKEKGRGGEKGEGKPFFFENPERGDRRQFLQRGGEKGDLLLH